MSRIPNCSITTKLILFRFGTMLCLLFCYNYLYCYACSGLCQCIRYSSISQNDKNDSYFHSVDNNLQLGTVLISTCGIFVSILPSYSLIMSTHQGRVT